MGWTTLYRESGLTDREFFEREFPTTLTTNGRIVECATVGGVFYAAVENTGNAPYLPGRTWALVVLVQRGRDGEFGYKEMDESMGPNETRCPARILDLLSPTDVEYANNWRERCRKNLAARKAKGTIANGETVRFTAPENVAALGPVTRIDARKGLFRRQDSYTTVHIPWWRKATWTTVTDA